MEIEYSVELEDKKIISQESLETCELGDNNVLQLPIYLKVEYPFDNVYYFICSPKVPDVEKPVNTLDNYWITKNQLIESLRRLYKYMYNNPEKYGEPRCNVEELTLDNLSLDTTEMSKEIYSNFRIYLLPVYNINFLFLSN